VCLLIQDLVGFVEYFPVNRILFPVNTDHEVVAGFTVGTVSLDCCYCKPFRVIELNSAYCNRPFTYVQYGPVVVYYNIISVERLSSGVRIFLFVKFSLCCRIFFCI